MGRSEVRFMLKLTFFLICLMFIAMDILTGWMKAVATATTNSSIMRVGLFHKLGEIMAILFGYACEFAFPYVGIAISIPLVESIGTYIILMEVASVVENIMQINPQLKEMLTNVFGKKEEGEDHEEHR